MSFNREAQRLVDSLREPGQPTEDLLQVLTYRRADGREVSLGETPIVQAFSSSETIRAEEIVMLVPDGRSVTALVNATPIYSQQGEVESFVVTLQDTTEVEELQRLRSELLGMVSQQLSTPLTSIRGSVTTLLDEGRTLDPAAATQFYRIILEQADLMRNLISDLLDMARIETGTLSVDPHAVDVADLVDEARNNFLSAGGRRSVSIDIPPGLPPVAADRRRIAQVIAILLANAARNSSNSSDIKVTVTREELQIAVSVSDEGNGVPRDLAPQLFRNFSRIYGGDQGTNLARTGLGLSICKGIVEAHGGRIRAESDGPGLGAQFTFTIPALGEPLNDATAVAVRSSPSEGSAGNGPVRVLVVEDDLRTLRYVRDALGEGGYAAILTADPNDALRLRHEHHPHVVLIDLMMPGSAGLKLMQRILDDADVPVIFLSDYGEDQIIAGALEMGAADYVVKPFSQTELTVRIGAALRRPQGRAGVGASEPYVLGELVIDYASRRVTLAGRPVQLTLKEYGLVYELSINSGRVLTYEYLLQRVWGQDYYGDVRPMRTAMSSLRRKLGDDTANPTYIFTEHRVGYRMAKGETPERMETALRA